MKMIIRSGRKTNKCIVITSSRARGNIPLAVTFVLANIQAREAGEKKLQGEKTLTPQRDIICLTFNNNASIDNENNN